MSEVLGAYGGVGEMPLFEVLDLAGRLAVRENGGVPGVVVVAVNAANQVLLGRHVRPAVDSEHWELPRGFGLTGDAGDDGLRELREETGLTGGVVRLVGSLYPNSGLLTTVTQVVEVVVDGIAGPTDGELSVLRWTDADQVASLLCEGRTVDAISAAAWMLYQRR